MTEQETAQLADVTIAKGIRTGFECRDLTVLHNQLLAINCDRFEADFNEIFKGEDNDVKD